MFGQNEIVGRKYFEKYDLNEILVTSRFFTIQGEGPLAGRPALFIRLAKCNLNCSFCDTFFDAGTVFTFDELYDEMQIAIKETFGDNIPQYVIENKYVVVLTGGEPTLQSDRLVRFVRYLRNKLFGSNFEFQFESNGTHFNSTLFDICTAVVSPKVSEKTQKYLKPSNDVLNSADAIKFVVSADPASSYHKIPDWVDDSLREYVYVSPMNIYNEEPRKTKEQSASERSKIDEVISFWTPGLLNQQQNQANHEYAAKLCIEHGYKLNLQTHLYASLA